MTSGIRIKPHVARQDHLTDLERTVLHKLCEGLTFSQIDDALLIEKGTAHRLRKPLFRKIGVRTRHEATAAVHPASHISRADLEHLLVDHYYLTKRECDVLLLMFYTPELSRRQIGEQLGISDNTVRLCMNHINKKLDVSSRAEAVHRIHTCHTCLQERGDEHE